MDGGPNDRMARMAIAAEQTFGEPVQEIEAPGGEDRSSIRLRMRSLSVIATLRPNYRRTMLEAHVLRTLAPFTDDVPRALGFVDNILFQSDVGRVRLSTAMAAAPFRRRVDLADDAVAAIFRIQAAARQTDLNTIMPHLGADPVWTRSLVNDAKSLAVYGLPLPPAFDRNAAVARLTRGGEQFVKWDCRSGNAALGDRDGRLRWFDFEYAGLRHGAEDLAWLIADETVPVAPDILRQIVIDNFDASCGHAPDDYMDYLSTYVALHAVQRLKLIADEVRRRGWRSKDSILRRDDVGRNPAFALHLCRVGAHFAAHSRVAAPLVRNFEQAEAHFGAVVTDKDPPASPARP